MLVKESLMVDNLIIYQDDELYRFTSDAVLLSHFASVKANEVVADFCSGSGIVGINFFALHKNLVQSVDLFEMQTPLFNLSCKTVEENKLNKIVFPHNVKVQDITTEYVGKFSLILCNPPYMEAKSGATEENESIAVCRREITLSLKELCASASRALKFKGRFALCHRADRLADVISELKKNNIEPKKLQFVYSGSNEEPYLVLIEGVKGGKSGIKILKNIKNQVK